LLKLLLISVVQPPGTLKDMEWEPEKRRTSQTVSLLFSMRLACCMGKPCCKTDRTSELRRSNSLLHINGGSEFVMYCQWLSKTLHVRIL